MDMLLANYQTYQIMYKAVDQTMPKILKALGHLKRLYKLHLMCHEILQL